jgi:hypothetical protein
MTSYLIDKLEELRANEADIKEKQRVLQEEIELEIEKQRRLEMCGTITKLKTQISMISKNIEGKIMPNNYSLVVEKALKKINKEQVILDEKSQKGLIDITKYNIKNQDLCQRRRDLHKQQRECIMKYKSSDPASLITLEKFKKNLSQTDEDIKERYINSGKLGNFVVDIPFEIKIYDEIVHIFTTMLGIMKKQEYEIATLKGIETGGNENGGTGSMSN